MSENVVIRIAQARVVLFAIGLIGLGTVALVYGDFAEVWQPVAAWMHGHAPLAYASGILMVLSGVGLVFDRTTALAARILFPVLIIGFLVQLPILVTAPLVEVNWESAGELGILLGAGWVLFAARSVLGDESPLAFATGERGVRIGRIIFGVALLPIALSHFVYHKYTATLVPTWLPFSTAWVYLTGAGHLAAALGVLFSVRSRLAATMEGGMLAVFTLFVWLPKIVMGPTPQGTWTEFFASWAMTAAAWVVADSISTK